MTARGDAAPQWSRSARRSTSARGAGLRSAAFVLGVVGLTAAASGQTIDCNRLALQIVSVQRDPSAVRYAAAAQKQAAELNRTAAYARSIGCDRFQFLFFGAPKPPQCDGLNAQVARMQANLGQLQRAAAAGGAGLKSRLQGQYDAYCRPRRGFLEEMFGGDTRVYPPTEPPPDEGEPREADTGPRRGGSVAVCVRTCDGGYFPLSYSATRRSLGDLQDLCTALCPNTEARVYTRRMGGDMKAALSAEGAAYTDLANAFKYEKTYDTACSCKPPDKSWAQALAPAEEMIERRKGDIAVTPALSEELSRPGAKFNPAAVRFDPKAARKALDEQKRREDATAAAPIDPAPAISARSDKELTDDAGLEDAPAAPSDDESDLRGTEAPPSRPTRRRGAPPL